MAIPKTRCKFPPLPIPKIPTIVFPPPLPALPVITFPVFECPIDLLKPVK
jgi:hypothetical protein